jgi:formamidase
MAVVLGAFCVSLCAVEGPGGETIVVVGGEGNGCREDAGCVNRLHPDIPMAATAMPGQTILFRTRDAADALGAVSQQSAEPGEINVDFGLVHPLTGPVFIEGADAGDVLAVTLMNIEPGRFAWSQASSFGFASELVEGDRMVVWRLNQDYAVTDGIPGVQIPNSGFPGIVTTLPGPAQLEEMLAREQALLDAGGTVFPPLTAAADPAAICGEEGRDKDRCLRTIPPREHGGNLDIRYLQAGVTLYLPCFIKGCGLAIGDVHFAQGDGEVAGTAIEMSANVSVVTEVIKNGPDLTYGPHYKGPARVLDIPSRSFYAVTGFPLKKSGTIPPDMAYLDSAKVVGLENLSGDINLAASNALAAMIDYISTTYGYDRLQAYIIASVAVDLRIGQLVDFPNVGVTAILPLDIFSPR